MYNVRLVEFLDQIVKGGKLGSIIVVPDADGHRIFGIEGAARGLFLLRGGGTARQDKCQCHQSRKQMKSIWLHKKTSFQMNVPKYGVKDKLKCV